MRSLKLEIFLPFVNLRVIVAKIFGQFIDKDYLFLVNFESVLNKI